MDSLTFTPGRAFLSSESPAVPWTAVFEDEGPAGYFYACDRSHETLEHSILDAMLIYNSADAAEPDREHIASIEWSSDGQQCALYIDGTAQAFIDFATQRSFCRTNFPNFIDEQGGGWRKDSHAWDENAIQQFEAVLYA